MIVKLNTSSLRETQWYEYVLRFLFGGVITACAGIIARKFGPVVGGLFLAFPAIFPASATLVEKHVKEEKQQKGLPGEQRGREVAALEAVGAAMGSAGLFLFAVLVWAFLPRHRPWLILLYATCAWALASVAIWQLRMKS